MENIFSFDVFLINVPIYLAFILAGYMLAIKPKRDKKNRANSLSNELYENTANLKVEKFEDFEVYLKIAKLHRKNGEFEKSVQIHKKLLEKDVLTKELESRITLELGRDYISSGLFDKAEETLLMALKLVAKNSERERSCLLELSKLYERQIAWAKAVEYRRKLVQFDESHKSSLALLLCNLGTQEHKQKNVGNAKGYFQEALETDKDCVLAVTQLVKIAFEEKKLEDVFSLVKDYSEKSTKLLNLLAFAFKELLENKEYTAQTVELLENLVKKSGCDYEVGILFCHYLLNTDKKEQLHEHISNYNETHKNNLQAIYAMALFLKESKFDYDSKDHSNVLLEKIENMLKNEYNYQCGSCGYHTKQEFWYCPQCQKWDTIDRIHR